MEQEKIEELIEAAKEAREHAYAPYSNFMVGAALLAKSGKIYTGANMENAAYSPTMCAERVAFAHAVFDGCRDFVAIAVVGALRGQEPDTPCPPCGVCRQIMMEFCQPEEFMIYLADGNGYRAMTLVELLPLGFGGNNIKG